MISESQLRQLAATKAGEYYKETGGMFGAGSSYKQGAELFLEPLLVAMDALREVIDHEIHHGVNQGKPSEVIAQEALLKIEEMAK